MDGRFRQRAEDELGEDIFTVYVSGCTAAKRDKHCDAVITTTELFAWIQRACVSRFTTLDVWEKTGETPAERLFDPVPFEGELAYACPGGCENGGGQFRTQGYQK